MLIHPFNYDNHLNYDLMELEEAREIYEEIWAEATFPDGAIKGNAPICVFYTANGEASDWMLGEHGIIAFSPELGIDDYRSDSFYIQNQNVL